MMVYLLRWRVRPDREDAFRSAWATLTLNLREAGSHGSALFRASDGTWCGIARWPDAETRDAAMGVRASNPAQAALAECVEGPAQVLELSEVLNLWAPFPATPTA